MRLLIGLIFSLVIPLVCFSQDTVRISYGERINLGRVPLNFDFEASFNEKKTLILGTAINDIKFDTPGLYLIRTIEKIQSKYFGKKISSEEHGQLPSQFFILVDSLSVSFISESIKTTQPIRKGQTANALLLSIECEIKHFNEIPLATPNWKVKAAGIGADLNGELIKMKKTDRKNIYLLTYSLKGICSEVGYIQFDFEANGQKIIPIGWREEIR
jgi:hypothetical protein